jgi:hypothetical protein
MNTTKVEKNDFKGNEMFSIYEFNEKGEKNFKPLVNLGKRKAKLILKHMKELEHYVERTK